MRKARICLMLGILFFSFIFTSQNAHAWLSGWNYRKAITVNNTANSNALTDYQVPVNLTYNSNMQTDFSDIRFTWYNSTDSTETEIPYWIESKVNSAWAYVWVKVTQIPASSYATIYVYYGNTSVVNSASNGTATFIYFNDGSKIDFDQQVNLLGSSVSSYTTNGSVITHTEAADQYEQAIKNITLDNLRIGGKVNFGTLESIEAVGLVARFVSYKQFYFIQGEYYTGYTNSIRWGILKSNTTAAYVLTSTNSPAPSANTWYKFEFRLFGSNLYFYFNGNLFLSATDTQFTSGYFGLHGDYSQGVSHYYDDIYVAKYTSPEPTYSVGAEEKSNTPPQYSNVLVSPSSPQTYGINDIWFNITWTDSDGVDKAWITHNFAGTSQNYTMSNDTASHFYYHLTFTPAAGTYSYTFYANDTLGATNSTSGSYTIDKATTTIHLAINGTEADTTVIYPNVTNATAWKTVTNGNLSLYRNGTIVSSTSTLDSVSEIIQHAAGSYNYTATLDHQNYTASPVTRILTVNKGDSQLSLTASPNWNVAGETQVTITCSANSALNVTLYKDSVLVSNPYTAVLPFGIYNFVCNISDQQNYTPPTTSQYLYVTTGGLGCTDNSTYAFKSAVSTSFPVNLNFTSLVGRNFVKPDLSDVWVNTSILTANKNTTNGYYLVVTNTTPLSNFTLYFGNYLGNQSYTGAAMATNTIDISYQENSPYYYIALVNENDGTSLLPPSANTTMVLYCSEGVSSFKVDNSTFLVATYEQLSSLRAIVAYSASDIYYRDYIVRSPVEFRNLYLVDATKNQVLQMLFRLTDNTGNFGNSTFRVKKYLGGNVITINEIKFDVENKAIVYLMNGGKYTLYIDNGVEERAVGELYPDPSDLQKYIILNEITAFNVSTANVTQSLTFIDGVFNFVWADPTGQTIMVEFYVYNYTDQSVLFAANSTNKTYINFVYTTPDKNAAYTTKYLIHHSFYGENTTEVGQNWKAFGLLLENPISQLIVSLGGGEIFFFLIFVVSIPMFFAQRFAGVGAIVLLIVVAFLAYTGLYNIANSVSGIALLGIALFFAVLIEYQQRKRYRE